MLHARTIDKLPLCVIFQHLSVHVSREMAERTVEEFRSEVAIGIDDIQPAQVAPTQQEGEKTLGMYMYMYIYST